MFKHSALTRLLAAPCLCPCREIEELKDKYESKLTVERESSLRLKGENGIMRKKFNALQVRCWR